MDNIEAGTEVQRLEDLPLEDRAAALAELTEKLQIELDATATKAP